MPPESAPRKAGDVWAAGLVVAEVFARDLPFRACDSHVRTIASRVHIIAAQRLTEPDQELCQYGAPIYRVESRGRAALGWPADERWIASRFILFLADDHSRRT